MKKTEIGVIIISHGNMGRELLACAERILGKQKFVRVLSVLAGDDIALMKRKVKKAMDSPSLPEKKIILVDIMGGTPANAILAFVKRTGVEIVSGMNLAMMLSLFSKRGRYSASELALKELVSVVCRDSRKGILDMGRKCRETLLRSGERVK